MTEKIKGLKAKTVKAKDAKIRVTGGGARLRVFRYDPWRLAKALIIGACLAIANGLIAHFAKPSLWGGVLIGFVVGAGVSCIVDNPWKERK